MSDSWQMQEIRRDARDDQPDAWWVERHLKNNWECRTRSDIPLRYFRQGNRQSYRPGRKTTGYDVARGVDLAWRQIGRTWH